MISRFFQKDEQQNDELLTLIILTTGIWRHESQLVKSSTKEAAGKTAVEGLSRPSSALNVGFAASV